MIENSQALVLRDAMDQVSRSEVPVEQPVEVLVWVVGLLVSASMADAELVGDLEQGIFVLAQQFCPEE